MLIMNMIVILIIVLLGKDFEYIITRLVYRMCTGRVTWYNSTMKKMRELCMKMEQMTVLRKMTLMEWR